MFSCGLITELNKQKMNTVELIKDICLFGGAVPNERIEEVRDFLDNLEKQLTIPVVVGQSEQLVCDLCNENGWIVENKGDIIERRLCKCDKSK